MKSTTPKMLADDIEAKLKKLGLWRAAPPKFGAGAFGGPTAMFEEWLQWILIPRLRRADRAPASSTSQLATAAVRNLDGVPGIEKLVQLLSEVDRLASANRSDKR